MNAATDVPTVSCPQCGAEQEDHDGFGVLHCEGCGFCTHAAQRGMSNGEMQCEICEQVVTA